MIEQEMKRNVAPWMYACYRVKLAHGEMAEDPEIEAAYRRITGRGVNGEMKAESPCPITFMGEVSNRNQKTIIGGI